MANMVESLISLEPREILSEIHNSYALKFGDYYARILEAEYYASEDPYIHGNEKQKEMGTFYVHRTGKLITSSYKAASYKGMDITLGGSSILIRSIHIATSTRNDQGQQVYQFINAIDGPCCCVNAICDLTGWTLPELEANMEIVPCRWGRQKKPIYGSRVGLTLKRAPNDEEGLLMWMRYLVAPLRSAIYMSKKGKETFFVVDTHRQDITTTIRDKYISLYNEGKDAKCIAEIRNAHLLTIAGFVSTQ